MTRWVFVWAVLMSSLAGCGQDNAATGGPAMATINGTVLYRERMMLPPGARLTVELQDISIADAPAQVISGTEQAVDSAPPYGFSLDYDRATLQDGHTYSLRASISAGGQLMFTTTEYIDPFAEQVEIVLTRVSRAATRSAPALEDSAWQFVEIDGEAVPEAVNGKAVFLQFDAAESRAFGYAGCNRYTGGYSREGAVPDGAALNFGAMAGTRMACVEGMDIEDRLYGVFGRVSAFRLGDEQLELVGESKVLARLVPLPQAPE